MAAAEQQQTRHRNCEHWINKRVQPGWASGAEGVMMMIELPAARIWREQVFIK
jgi:hypothetical protein